MRIQNILIICVMSLFLLSSISFVSADIRWANTSSCVETVGEPDGVYNDIGAGATDCIGEDFNLTGLNLTGLRKVDLVYVFNITEQLNNDEVVIQFCKNSSGCSPSQNLASLFDNTNTPVDNLINFFFFDDGILNMTEIQNLRLQVEYTQITSQDSSSFVDSFGIQICDENWVLNNSQCTIFDNQTVIYVDNNSCGTFNDLPADNGTTQSCDFCTSTFECSLFDDSCGSGVSTLNCLNTQTQNNSCCLATNLSSDCFFAGNLSDFELICGILDLTLIVPTFPYVDFNVTYPMELIFTQNNITVNLTDFKLNLTDLEGNISSFDFVFDTGSQSYKLNLLFTEEGDFPFRIFSTSPYDNIPNIVGTLIVRKPYFITFEAFEEKNSRFFGRSNIGAYKNKFAVLTAELRRTKRIRFDPILEHYITPLFYATSFNTPVFSAPYDNGVATLKLWETGEYGFRLIDAREITFDGVFVVPNVTDTYGLNAFVGVFTFNGSDQTIEVFFDEKDTNQYRWLLNILFVISLVLIIATSVFLFFVIPSVPQLSIIFGLGFTTMLILFRVFLFIWRGW